MNGLHLYSSTLFYIARALKVLYSVCLTFTLSKTHSHTGSGGIPVLMTNKRTLLWVIVFIKRLPMVSSLTPTTRLHAHVPPLLRFSQSFIISDFIEASSFNGLCFMVSVFFYCCV